MAGTYVFTMMNTYKDKNVYIECMDRGVANEVMRHLMDHSYELVNFEHYDVDPSMSVDLGDMKKVDGMTAESAQALVDHLIRGRVFRLIEARFGDIDLTHRPPEEERAVREEAA